MDDKTSSNILLPAQPESHTLIQMRGITKVFKVPAGEVTVLKGIDVDFYQGEFVSVVGRSGSGKSTLVNMITGIDHPTTGSVKVGSTYIHTLSEGKMAVWRGKNLGIVFQFYQLLPMLTLVENVMLPMDFCNIYARAEREEKALKLLARVGMENHAYKLPGAISGGQQQSVAVARALANDPPVIIADEPTGNLDSRTAEQVMHLFEELVAQGKTIIMVTHDNTLASLTTRNLVISDGEVIPDGVVKAFQNLPHSSLLQITHLARHLNIAPNSPLLLDQEAVSHLYVILAGNVALLAHKGSEQTERIASFAPRAQLDLSKYCLDSFVQYEIAAEADQPADLLVFDRQAVQSILEPTLHKTIVPNEGSHPIDETAQEAGE